MIMLHLLNLLAPAQAPAPPPISFPINAPDFGYFSLDDLQRLEVTLVRPLGNPRGERRGNVLMVLQRFTVVDARTPVGRIVDVRLPNRDPRRTPKTIIGLKPTAIRFAAPRVATYLLFAEKPANGRLPQKFVPTRPDYIGEPPSFEAASDERLGIALVETPLTRLPRNASYVGDTLRALASSSIRPKEPLYSALPTWNWLLPISASTWAGVEPDARASRDTIEGLPALGFYRTQVAPLFPSATLKARDVQSVQYWALQAKWGVPGALSAVADRLEHTIEAGQETAFSFPYDALDALRPEDATTEEDRAAWKRIVRASEAAQSGYLRRLGNRADGKPNVGGPLANP